MKRYLGERTASGVEVTVVDGEQSKPLNARYDLRFHSPSGFEMGYAGSGPAQLGLALCCDVLGDDERAQSVYMRFKSTVIARIDGESFELSEEQIRKAIENIEEERLEC